ncbi:hypothetical protein SAMN05720764_1218 [Fibrobacter sp. UWH5]|uniref:hypothetical protein n=1 Tax=Fibrobacter sp. UWH5 TaxID=1896211 RepID=UPI0009228B89|nr:hypothetical protein [Fibrobacter sp. UWH5]SHL70682.1 hypothetical protein SAMN05720764_1218 [Fibrobacter sp. UWH5]
MRSKDLKSLFEMRHVMSSHSRPHTSNDNAFAESICITMNTCIQAWIYCRLAQSILATIRKFSIVETPCWKDLENCIPNALGEGESSIKLKKQSA